MARKRFAEEVGRLAARSLSADDIAAELRHEGRWKTIDGRTVEHYAADHGIQLAGGSETGERGVLRLSGSTESSAEEGSIAPWWPPPPLLPIPNPGFARRLVRFYEDNFAEMGWLTPYDAIEWLWSKANRVSALKQQVKDLKGELARTQGQVGAWQRWHDVRVRSEVERRTSVHRCELDASYGSLMERLRAEVGASYSRATSLATEVQALRAGLFAENRETEALRKRLAELQWSYDTLKANHDALFRVAQTLRAGLFAENRETEALRKRLAELQRSYDTLEADYDAVIRVGLNREGLQPDVDGLLALIGRLNRLAVEQFWLRIGAWGAKKSPERAQLRNDGRLVR